MVQQDITNVYNMQPKIELLCGHTIVLRSMPSSLLYSFRYLTHPDDMKTMVAGARLAMNFQNTFTFQKYQLELLVDKDFCGDRGPVTSDEYLECVIQHHITTVWSLVSTCKPGRDPMAIMDSKQLRVGGFE